MWIKQQKPGQNRQNLKRNYFKGDILADCNNVSRNEVNQATNVWWKQAGPKLGQAHAQFQVSLFDLDVLWIQF